MAAVARRLKLSRATAVWHGKARLVNIATPKNAQGNLISPLITDENFYQHCILKMWTREGFRVTEIQVKNFSK